MHRVTAAQKIQYAKGKSNTVAKLDGTYRMPTVTGTEIATTELQQSIFNAPPSSAIAAAAQSAPATKAPQATTNGVEADTDGPKGVKRVRDDESDDEGAPMEEDDSDAPMEASSDED